MELITCANATFLINAINLARSFNAFYSSTAHICIFGEGIGDLPSVSGITFHRLTSDVPHAFNPRFYYFKTAALNYGFKIVKSEFIYLDSRYFIFSRGIEIEKYLERNSRFFVQYPQIEILKNKYWTTLKCIEKCEGQSSNEVAQYTGGIQAYVVTSENRAFAMNMMNLMADPEVAGPSNHLRYPDGEGTTCVAHRNDQSVLTMMIGRYGFQQPYDPEIARRYGDIETIERFHPQHGLTWQPVFRGRCNFNNLL
jgi:hypothetical protein